MRNLLKDYFHFTRSERNGIILFSILAFATFLIPKVSSHFNKPEAVDFSEMEEAVKSMQLSQTRQSVATQKTNITNPFPFDPNKADKNTLMELGLSSKIAQIIINYRQKGGRFYKKSDLKKIYGITTKDYEILEDFIQIKETNKTNVIPKKKYYKAKPEKQASKIVESELFPFNPNTATKEELQQLGLSDKVSQTILKFRKRGNFRKVSDLSLIYGLSEEDFQLLKPFIQIPPKESFYNKKPLAFSSQKKESIVKAKLTSSPTSPPVENINIDINQSSREDWQQLSGIGPYLAKKIISHRDNLGGFASIEQIADTYELPDSVYQKIVPHLTASPILKPININTVKAKDLQSHPFFSWKQANTIINYRTQHGDFKNEKDLSKILSFKKDYIKKISPYLEY